MNEGRIAEERLYGGGHPGDGKPILPTASKRWSPHFSAGSTVDNGGIMRLRSTALLEPPLCGDKEGPESGGWDMNANSWE